MGARKLVLTLVLQVHVVMEMMVHMRQLMQLRHLIVVQFRCETARGRGHPWGHRGLRGLGWS